MPFTLPGSDPFRWQKETARHDGHAPIHLTFNIQPSTFNQRNNPVNFAHYVDRWRAQVFVRQTDGHSIFLSAALATLWNPVSSS
jgi:hypothetical protein